MTELPCRPTPINIMCKVCETGSQVCASHAVYRGGSKLEDEVKLVGRWRPNARFIGGFVGSKTRSGCAAGSRHHYQMHLSDFMPPQSTNCTSQPTCVRVEAHCVPNSAFCKVKLNGRKVQQFQMSVKEVLGEQCSDSSAQRDTAEAAPKSGNEHKRGNRRRRKRQKRRNKAQSSKAQVADDPESNEIRITATTNSPKRGGSRTTRDLLVHVESASSPPLCNSPPKNTYPTSNPTLAFILGGNEDLSDVDSDWDEVDSDDEDYSASFPVGFVFKSLPNGVFSVSVFAGNESRCRDEGFDDIDGVVHSPSVLHEANARWKESYSNVKIVPRDSKVHFPTDDILVVVRKADDIDRKGTWERAANDRLRFQCRISNAEKILAPVLSTEHRQKVLQRNTAS
ncbi:uncharacterized protein LOC135393770 [Ornithodoros turicata]|uniref:uncharacterized protein LOC135393770 n=1 Tax=Ornithodoros turicata TaxID=34597 RepID=UPI0031395C42